MFKKENCAIDLTDDRLCLDIADKVNTPALGKSEFIAVHLLSI